MSEFSADKAAFFIFDKREDKPALRRLGLAYVLVRFSLFALVIALSAPFVLGALPELLDLAPDSTEFAFKVQSFSNVFQAVGLLAGLVFLPVFIAIYTALLRWMIHGQSGGKWFGLRFGEQELHVLVVFIAVVILIVFGALFSLIPLGILIGVTMAMTEGGNGAIPLTATILYGTFWFGALVWFSVRLSPATALTVQRGKIQIFEAMKVSKGHFWGLFLAYILQFFVILAMSLALVVAALLVSLPFLGIGVAMFGWGEPSMTNVGTYVALAAVPLLVITIVGLVLEYIRYAMGAGVGACLVVAQAGDGQSEPVPPVLKPEPQADDNDTKEEVTKTP